jgi:hypothetical protein
MTIEHLIPGFRAETMLEHDLASDPVILDGLAWGRPRPGHPEGCVGSHVADLLAAIPEPAGARRTELRFLALVHDARKCHVDPHGPATPDNDHAVLARRHAERYTADARLLEALELHDEPYRIWRADADCACAELEAVLDRIPDLELFLRFVALDGSTRGKDPRPMAWLHAVVATQSRAGLALAA